jgi:LacI family transcriptional regulator
MTLLDLAKKLRVSPSTVSRALNPATSHLISDQVRSRIQGLAVESGYVPNRMAQNLVTGRTHTIGVILYSAFGSLFFDDYLARVQQGIYEALGHFPAYGCKLAILPRGKSLSEADQHLIGNGVDGILISTICDLTAERMRDLADSLERRWQRPTVVLNLDLPFKTRVSTVGFSNKDAAHKAVTHLLQRGHKRIGMIYTNDGSADVVERVKGYKQALADHQAPYDPLLTMEGHFTSPSGYKAALQLFKVKATAKMTALFCTNDEMAMGAIRALKVLRKPCPQQMAVMGFDGLIMGDYVTPRLSTVSQPMFEIAKTGTRLLLDLIEGRQKAPVHLTVPSQLQIRESA